MGFIREKIKEKPINKKKLFSRIGMAALCGLVFALAVCGTLLLLKPSLQEMLLLQETEKLGSSEDTSTQPEETEEFLIPPVYSLSLENYQKLQKQLSEIGEETGRAIVSIGNATDWMSRTQETAQGTGTIIAADNNYLYILTEEQVISDIDQLQVTFTDGTGADAKLLKADHHIGLVVLTVGKRQLKASTQEAIAVAKLGSSYELESGSLVIALGSPLGVAGSIAMGNITSVENQISMQDKNYSILTTDIPAGNDGSGVLVNVKGEIVGIMLQSLEGEKERTTLRAVPIAVIATQIEQLQNGKDVPYIGLYISTITEDIAADYELPMGVFIKEVVADSPAMKAGLQSGDVITHINGEEVLDDATYSEKISQLIPGTTCEISVKRQNGSEYYEVTCEVTIEVL